MRRADGLTTVSTEAVALTEESQRLVTLAGQAEAALTAALQQRAAAVAERDEVHAACEGLAKQLQATETEQETLQQALAESQGQLTALQEQVEKQQQQANEQRERGETLEFELDQATIEACEVPMLKAQLAEAKAAIVAAEEKLCQHESAGAAEQEARVAAMQEAQQAVQTEVERRQALEATLASVTAAHAALQSEQQRLAGQARDAAEQRLVSDEVGQVQARIAVYWLGWGCWHCEAGVCVAGSLLQLLCRSSTTPSCTHKRCKPAWRLR